MIGNEKHIPLLGTANGGTTELSALALVREGKVEECEHTLCRCGAGQRGEGGRSYRGDDDLRILATHGHAALAACRGLNASDSDTGANPLPQNLNLKKTLFLLNRYLKKSS